MIAVNETAASPEQILGAVRSALDALRRAGERHDGLIPSVLTCDSAAKPDEMPPSIPGQRNSDRSYGGCNLLDDQGLLRTMYAFGERHRRFERAADSYVGTFLDRCTDTETDLFPWGDHAFWHLETGRVGDSYCLADPTREPDPVHDQRLQAPHWLWDRLAAEDADAVERFADGLDYHWNDEDRSTFDRHAYIQRCDRHAFDPAERATDFPRHTGYFVLDLASAYVLGGEAAHRDQLRRFADYWWTERDGRGLLHYESRGDTAGSPEQTLSLACSFLDAAAVLAGQNDELAAVLESRAETYLDGVSRAVHDGMPVWGSGYPNSIRAAKGLAYLSAWRHTGTDWLRSRAVAIAEAYRRVPLPRGRPVRAGDPALALELLVDLHDVTGTGDWLDRARTLANETMDRYLDGTLPRAAPGADHYEAQVGSGTLLRALARTGLAASEGRNLPPEYGHLPAGWHRTESHDWGPGWG